MRTSTALAVIAILGCHPAFAAPEGGLVVGGSATIEQAGSTTTIRQSTQRGIINWNSFDVGAGETVDFQQPGRSSITVNRIFDSKASQINGHIKANGNIMLLNSNGVLFGNSAQVDVGGLVASSGDLINPNEFMTGAAAQLAGGTLDASIINEGRITAAEAGLVGLIAPNVRNDGVIAARLGTISLAGGNLTTFDLAGDGLISIAVSDDVLAMTVTNAGAIQADGGHIQLTAAAARDLVESLIVNSGTIAAATVAGQKGSVALKGEGAVIQNTGAIHADGNAALDGGSVAIEGKFVSLGGDISANGKDGGDITINSAATLSLAGSIQAEGINGNGGTVEINGGGNTWETSTSRISTSGKVDGGLMRIFSAYNHVSSGQYVSVGDTGRGGNIDISAGSVKMLSASVDASGARAGGQIRIGGEYQGGKNLPLDRDEVPNAQIVTLDRTTRLRADGEDTDGDGGTIIVWSDVDTMALGSIYARPGSLGTGGFVEVSSGDVLNYGADIQTGAGGTVLLDPKNIIIADATFNSTAIIMGRGYTTAPNIAIPDLDSDGVIGVSVSLDGNRMAVGHHLNNGFTSTSANTQSGAIYLYSFTDATFSGAVLEGVIGHGYTGGKNVDVSAQIGGFDVFGASVSLDGNRLAVGATGDDGNANALGNSGAVYLFTFSDAAFTGGTLQARIGHNYTTGKNINLAGIIGANDFFGNSVSLDGNQLAVGARYDDGVLNNRTDAGAVHFFTFTDATFTGGSYQGTAGYGYTGGKNIDLTSYLDNSDDFGLAISLNAGRLAASARTDDGVGNTVSNAGAVYLFTFSDLAFTGGTTAGVIGRGYTGGVSINQTTIDASDLFGTAVALDGNRLFVGAAQDDGNANSAADSGAIYMYSFTDSSFAGAVLEGRIGNNYAALGGKNISRANEAAGADQFALSLAVDGQKLVVGAIGDDGSNNANSGQGAFHYYTFSDLAFNGLSYQGTLGTGYTGGKNINFAINTSAIGNYDVSVSVDNNRIAIGLSGDDGFNDTVYGSGAVYLYSFTSSEFDGAVLESIIGHGYTGGKNVNMSAYLQADDRFGSSVSLDGNRLAVGAMLDDGNANALTDSGAVYLFSFSDSLFSGGTLEGRIGRNYTTGKNFNPANLTGTGDVFGSTVSLDGNRLAVGAYGDDGNANARNASGAVYLFSFADSVFTTPTQQALIGYNYTTGKNFNISQLEANDELGRFGLSLEGNRLAVSAWLDDGSGNTATNAGAVYLFSFADSLFTTPTLQSTVGKGYAGGKNIDIANLANDDRLAGVALEGNILAIGAPFDDGLTNTATDAGSIYIYAFSDNLFSGGTLDAIFGNSYVGGKNIALTHNAFDYLGYNLDLNQGTLVTSLRFADGANNGYSQTSEFYIFRGNSYIPSAGSTFSNLSTGTIGITPGALSALLSTPQNVTLQANNDILINNNLIVNNASGNGGSLTLQAGRSITINANITTDNGNLNLYANEDLSTGVVNAQRDAGAAVINMAAGTTINAGTGAVNIRLEDGTGKTNRTSGNITLNNITAGSLLVNSVDPASSIVVNGVLNASGSGTPITLAAGKDFRNNYGAGALVTPSGRWLIYSDSPALNILGGLSPAFFYHNCTYTGSCVPDPGNGIFYEYGDRLLSVSVNTSRAYGDANPTLSALQSLFVFTGFQNGDDVADLDLLPTLSVAGTANATAAAGTSHAITLSGGADNFYSYYFLDTSELSITQKAVTATWNAPLSKVYGDANPTPSVPGLFSYSGFANGDTLSVITASTIDLTGITALTGVGSYAINATLTATNYNFNIAPGQLNVTPRALTATWTGGLSRVYGDANPAVSTANFTYSGFVNGDTGSVITATGNYGAITSSTNVGSHAVGANFSATNYTISNAPTTTLTINKRNITAAVGNSSRAYGDTNPTWGWADVTWSNLANSETGAVIDTFTLAAPTALASSNAGTTHNINLSGFSDNNYNLTGSTAGTLTINKRDITASVNSTSRAYGDANPTLGWADVTWSNLANSETGAVIDTLTLATPTALATSNASTTHSINLSGFSDNNYNLTGSTAGTLTINKRDITAAVGSTNRAYGDANPTLGWADVTWSNLANSETGAVIDAFTLAAPTALATSNAGTTHNINLSGFSDNNYNLTGSTAGTLTINKRDITASVNSTSRAYGDANPTLGWADVTWSNLANSETGAVIDAFTLATPTALATSNAGTTHNINLSGFSDNNYNLIGSTAGTLTIAKRNITATVDSASRAYGDANPTLGWADVTWSNLANSETGAVIDAFTLGASTALATSNAGTTHNITLSGFSDNNYNLTSSTAGTLTINKRDITASVGNSSRHYGDAHPNLNWADVTWNNLANSETGAVIDSFTTVAPSAVSTAGAGTTHALSISAFNDNNYNLTGSVDGNLNITQAPVSIEAGNVTRLYGADNPSFSYSVIGLRNGETADVFSGVGLTTPATPTSVAGAYTITASGGAAANYIITGYIDGILTITGAPVVGAEMPATVLESLSLPSLWLQTSINPTLQQNETTLGTFDMPIVPDALLGSVGQSSDMPLLSMTERLLRLFGVARY